MYTTAVHVQLYLADVVLNLVSRTPMNKSTEVRYGCSHPHVATMYSSTFLDRTIFF